jgi:hypothetical protein
MSFLKQINIKEKFEIVQTFFYEYIWIKRSLYLIAASLVISFMMVQSAVPQFSVSAVLRENPEKAAVGLSGGGGSIGLLSFAAAADTSSRAFTMFMSNLHSYVIAQRMWDKGWGSEIFAGGIDDIDILKIPKNHKISEKLGAFLLGYELNDYFSPHDLQGFIQATVSFSRELKGTEATVTMLDSDKDFALRFLNDVILETDQYAKEFTLASSKATIEGTYKQLAISKNPSIKASLAATINSEYFKIASLDNDLPFHIYFIDPPYASEYPVTPNVRAIFISNIIIILFLSILISFVHKNKDDLW